MINLHIGTKIKIVRMSGEPKYSGKIGTITNIDSIGQLHGTWGGLAINLEEDEIEVIEDPEPDLPRYMMHDYNLDE